MDDLLSARVKVMTLGQYLRPTIDHMAVQEYINPDNLKNTGMKGSERALPLWKAVPWSDLPTMPKNIFCDNDYYSFQFNL